MSEKTPPVRSDDLAPPEAPVEPDQADDGSRRPTWLVVALVVAVAVIAGLVAVLVWPDSDDDAVTEPTATTETPDTTAPDSTPDETTPDTSAPTTDSPTTLAPEPVDAATAVFPDAAGGTRYDDPVEAASAFAAEFVGFVDPVVGEFAQGDARSGEVEVRSRANGPVTTVLVRQLGPDDSWWVLGSATADIVVATPGAGDAVTSPVTVTGEALAFEGNVEVEVRQDGLRDAIGTGFVTGGGDVMRPFSGEVEFTPPSTDRGALVFLTTSAEDGRVWQASVLRVRFG